MLPNPQSPAVVNQMEMNDEMNEDGFWYMKWMRWKWLSNHLTNI